MSKDGRFLSSYQEPAWMKKIGKLRKYANQAKGEKHWGVKLDEAQIQRIRNAPFDSRITLCAWFNISEGHWYAIRARRKWKHL